MSGEPDAQNNHVCVACSGFSDVSEVDQNGGSGAQGTSRRQLLNVTPDRSTCRTIDALLCTAW